MRLNLVYLILCLIGCTQPTTQPPTETVSLEEPKENVQQILVVTTDGWNTLSAELSMFEGSPGKWKQVKESIPVVVGGAGLAWGRGEEQARFHELEGPQKIEGDKRSPAGVFDLPFAFGYAEGEDFTKLEYVHVSNYIQCIEDISSAYYNRVVPDTVADMDWDSSDRMLRKDDLYEWGLMVAHNYPESEAGSGSCIFLHVWRDADHGTLGCTAMDKAFLRELIGWLDPAKKPQLIQMPNTYYTQFYKAEGWPKI
ncbi:MAG: hypothetical protein AAFR66_03365 [Bacteroidota bacterium]